MSLLIAKLIPQNPSAECTDLFLPQLNTYLAHNWFDDNALQPLPAWLGEPN
jgi:hypothetical protein